MGITELDVHDEAHTRGAYDAVVASRGFERPWWDASSYEEALLDWQHEDKSEQKVMWVAEDGGEVVGQAILWLPMDDNTTKGWFDLQVHPDHRNRGHGSALMARIVERSVAEGRSQIVTDVFVPTVEGPHAYRRFAEAHAFALSNTEVIRHLDLPVDEDLLGRLEAESRPYWEGRYRLETHVGGVPAHLLESLCAVMNRLAVDAPTGDVDFEEESLTPERYEEYRELEVQQQRVRLTTVAVDEATGDVVAYSDLMLPSGAPRTAWQWGTLVHGDHRGHRLGMAVKIENLRRLQADHPQRVRVTTGNDGTNSYMVNINEQLGFRVVEFCPAYQRKL